MPFIAGRSTSPPGILGRVPIGRESTSTVKHLIYFSASRGDKMALQDGQKPKETRYFAPGEIGFVVRHQGNDAPSPNDMINIILEPSNRDLLQKTRIGSQVIETLNG